MVAIDATTLLLLFQPSAGTPRDATGAPVAQGADRVEQLVADLEAQGDRLLIPTPALSEVLVRADASKSQAIVEELSKNAVFRIEPFDTRAALEVAAMTRRVGSKFKRGSTDTYAKIKYDRQIVAIAKVAGVETIYSDDGGLKTTAESEGLRVIRLADIPLPEKSRQKELFSDPGYGNLNDPR